MDGRVLKCVYFCRSSIRAVAVAQPVKQGNGITGLLGLEGASGDHLVHFFPREQKQAAQETILVHPLVCRTWESAGSACLWVGSDASLRFAGDSGATGSRPAQNGCNLLLSSALRDVWGPFSR